MFGYTVFLFLEFCFVRFCDGKVSNWVRGAAKHTSPRPFACLWVFLQSRYELMVSQHREARRSQPPSKSNLQKSKPTNKQDITRAVQTWHSNMEFRVILSTLQAFVLDSSASVHETLGCSWLPPKTRASQGKMRCCMGKKGLGGGMLPYAYPYSALGKLHATSHFGLCCVSAAFPLLLGAFLSLPMTSNKAT